MTNKQRKILNLLVTVNGIQYVLGTLRFNTDEFSYCFYLSERLNLTQEILQWIICFVIQATINYWYLDLQQKGIISNVSKETSFR